MRQEAVALLETLPPSRELAMAYGNMSQLRMQVSDDAKRCSGESALSS